MQPSFWAQKEAKTAGAVFRAGSPPKKVSVGYFRPCTRKLLIPPQAEDKAKRTVRPLI